MPTLIELEMARCCANLGREGPLFVKFPNFLSVETKPFDPETYEDELEDEDVLDEEGRARVKLKVSDRVRRSGFDLNIITKIVTIFACVGSTDLGQEMDFENFWLKRWKSGILLHS